MARADTTPRRRFRRLQGQLTLSYTIAACVSTLLLEAGLFGGLALLLMTSLWLPRNLPRELSRAALAVAPALAADPPDTEEARVWLRTAAVDLTPTRGITIGFSTSDNNTVAALVDRGGVVLASQPPAAFAAGKPLAPQLADAERPLLDAALADAREPDRLSQRTADYSLRAAAPVRTADGRTVGALYFRSQPMTDFREITAAFLIAMLPSALLVAGFSAVSGGVAGAVTARRLTRRLAAVGAAADAWGSGDFSVRAPEESDELGQLAARLNRMAAELRDLLALRQDVATLEERQRLARELHDTVKQQVFATAMQVGAARALLTRDPDAARARLDDADALAQQAQKELTAVLNELRPVSPGGASLPALLKSHAETWSRRTGVALALNVDPELAAPEATGAALLRIAQEALANVERHAAARRVEVTLERDGATLRLTVRDDGAGFDPRAASRRDDGGFGLASMRERAEALPGGRFDILSAPGAGTLLQVKATVVP